MTAFPWYLYHCDILTLNEDLDIQYVHHYLLEVCPFVSLYFGPFPLSFVLHSISGVNVCVGGGRWLAVWVGGVVVSAGEGGS